MTTGGHKALRRPLAARAVRAGSLPVAGDGDGDGEPKLQWLEAGRGVAALLVTLLHVANMMALPQYSGRVALGGIFEHGYLGVDFFFVLSGFIILFVNRHHAGRPAHLGSYALRRFTRIFPTYWVVLALALLVNQTLQRSKAPLTADWVVQQALLITPAAPWLGPAWTLQHELLFYVVFALALASVRLGAVAVAAWIAAVLATAALVPPAFWSQPQWLSKLLHPYSLHFVVGMLIAYVYPKPRALRRVSAVLLAAGLGCAALYVYGLERAPAALFLRYLAAALAFGGVLGGLLLIEARGIRPPPGLAGLGTVSYALYLIHVLPSGYLFAALVRLRWYHVLPQWALFGLTVALCVAAAVVIHRMVELPAIGLGKRIDRRLRAA